MKTKKLVALFLSVLMLLSSASALAADKEDVVYKEEDIARAKEYTDTLDTSGKTYDKHLTIEVASEMLDATRAASAASGLPSTSTTTLTSWPSRTAMPTIRSAR